MDGSVSVSDCDAALERRLIEQWTARFPDVHRCMHLDNGFAVVALDNDAVVGALSVEWRSLPIPAHDVREAFIDLIEVLPLYRRRGIASRMVERASTWARDDGAYQIRAWSSDDKTEAFAMWFRLGFALCPAVEETIRGMYVAKRL